MKTVRLLLYRDIVWSVVFVAVAFLSLFFFIDFVDELENVGRNGYTLGQAVLRGLLEQPGHFYELFPISVLIGTIYAMARLAQSSEFTILRTGGLGPGRALSLLAVLGVAFGVLTFATGDYLAPASEREAVLLKARVGGGLKLGGAGAWLKDRQRTPDGERSLEFADPHAVKALNLALLALLLLACKRDPAATRAATTHPGAVVPTAEEVGIRMCIHPDDPPRPTFGLPRIVGSVDDLAFILGACESDASGITFCTGSLGAGAANDVPAMARRFAGKIQFAHLRNVTKEPDGSFMEAEHLGGDVDMVAVVTTLLEEQDRRRDAGNPSWRIPFRPDHGHELLDDVGL